MKLEEQIKRIKELFSEDHHGGGGDKGRDSVVGGGTSSSSSGSYMSPGSFEQGGILTNNGRKDDIGELPQEVDITGGDSEEITLSVDDVIGKDPSVDVIKVIDNLVGAAATMPPPPDGDEDDPGGDPHGDDPGGDDEDPGDDPHGDDDYDPHGDDDYDDGGDDDWYDDDHPAKEPVKAKPPRDSMDYVPCCEPCGNGMWKRCNTDDCIYSTISDCELRGDNDTYSESTKSRTTFND